MTPLAVADLMNPRFGWISKTRSEAVESLLREVLEAWHADWSVHPPGSAGIEPTEERARFTGAGMALRSERDEDLVRIAMADVAQGSFGAWLAGVPETPDTLAEEVGTAALKDLVERMGVCMPGQAAACQTREEDWPTTTTHPRLGALLFAVRLGEFRLPLAVTRIGIDCLVPPEHRAWTKPDNWTSRQRSLESTLVTAEAVLSMGRISLREIKHLSPGEVLIGECSVDSKATLRIKGNSRQLASATPARRGQLRAITLASEPSKQELP